MKKLISISFSFVLYLIVGIADVFGQCAMCRATVENNISNGDTTVGAGLNMGILYLFVAPYLLIAVVGVLWYRHAKHKKKFSF
jgi:hypothetical protein